MGDSKLYINLVCGFFLSEQLLRCNQHQGWHLKARKGSKIPTFGYVVFDTTEAVERVLALAESGSVRLWGSEELLVMSKRTLAAGGARQ